MRLLARLIGWLLLGAAVINLGGDLFAYWEKGDFAPSMLGQLWFDLSPNSLNLAQVIVQRYVAPWLWDPPMIWLLNQPCSAAFGLVGFALVVLVPRPAQKRRIFRSPS